MNIDHATCGHVKHKTLDGTRHAEIHSAILELIKKWELAANRAEATGLPTTAAILRGVSTDLVTAMHPFEVEQ